MATKKPIVLTTGKLEELQAGDTIDTGVVGISALNNTSATIEQGKAVHLFNNAGTLEMELADASDNTKPCDGFTAEEIEDAQSGTVVSSGALSGFTGLTVAAKLYLSTTAGDVTATPPNTTGEIVQRVGKALSATQIAIEIDTDIRLA